MSYNLRLRRRSKAQRLKDEISAVPEVVIARLGVTTATLVAIDQQMLGELILPGMNLYPKFRMGQGLSVFDEGSPLLVFHCMDAHDVWLALKATHDHGWPFVARSGGHSTAGFSSNSETIIDLTGLDDIAVLEGNRVSVGPGVTFGKLNRFMKQHRLHIPTGNCDDVRCGGYVQGGGYGYTSRQFGLQCDSVAEATVLLGDGRTVKASADVNRDLFWAIRGGTGNNFGIIVNIVYQAVLLGEIWGFVYTWDAENAPGAMARAEDAFGPSKGLEIGYTGNITTVEADGVHKPVYMMSGICVDGQQTGKTALAPMLSLGSPTCMLDEVGYYFDINNAVEGKLPGIPEPIGQTYEIKSSGYLSKPMGLDGWRRLFGYFVDNIAKTNPYNLVVLEAYGGAINRVLWDATAFIHRDAIMEIYIDAFWRKEGGLGTYDQAQTWMDGINALLKPYLNGHWYQNYPQRDMPNFRWQYWGDAFNGLFFVKRKFDPGSRFSYEQCISPYPEEAGIVKSETPSIWSDPTITDSGLTPSFV
jgi:FAD binding domain/Berberine and berberine like